MTVGAWAPTRACHILILSPAARKIVNFRVGVKNILGLFRPDDYRAKITTFVQSKIRVSQAGGYLSGLAYICCFSFHRLDDGGIQLRELSPCIL